MIVPGQKIGHWHILAVDGRSATCVCRCKQVRVVSVEVLEGGASTSCGCRPLQDNQVKNLRAEQRRRSIDRDYLDWKPQRGR